jgi:hypothetical protein
MRNTAPVSVFSRVWRVELLFHGFIVLALRLKAEGDGQQKAESGKTEKLHKSERRQRRDSLSAFVNFIAFC